jgi:hypothetical protein
MSLMLWQDKYVLDILHREAMSSCKPIHTLISTSKITMVPDCLFFDPICFVKLLALFNISILWDQIFVLLLIRYINLCNLLPMHIGLLLNALYMCYLKGMIFFGIHIIRSSSFALHGFIDINWIDSVNDRKSTSRYLVFFGNTSISWKSGK